MLDLPLYRIASPDEARPAPLEAGRPQVLEWRTHRGHLVATGRHLDGRYEIHWLGLASFRFSRDDPELKIFPGDGADLHQVRDRCYRSVTPLWLHVRGQAVLHASAVKMHAGVVALTAPPNTGKSTLAYALSRQGHPLWADDAVPFRLLPSGVSAEPLPFFPRLRRPTAEHFGVESRKVQRHDAWATLKRRSAERLLAIYALERHHDRAAEAVRLERLSAVEGFQKVLSQTHSFGLGEADLRREIMGEYLQLAARVPVYRLRFQTGLENLPAILDTIEHTAVPTPLAS